MSKVEIVQGAQIAADHPCLPGHFPGQPVVPGVLMLDMVIAAIQQQWPGARVASLPSAKFLRPALPDEAFDISLSRDGTQVRFACGNADGTLCRGQLQLRQP